MRCRSRFPHAGALLSVVLVALGLAGCQSVSSELGMLFGDTPPAPVAAEASTGPKYLVEFRAEGQKPELIQMPLPEVLYVQQALEQSGALRKYRRFKIEIYRQLPGGGGHRLDIPFDRAKRQVPAAGDYAVHPNDRIVVTQDTSTVVDDMLQSLGGSLGNK